LAGDFIPYVKTRLIQKICTARLYYTLNVDSSIRNVLSVQLGQG